MLFFFPVSHHECNLSNDFKIFIGITGQQVSFTNRQDNTQNINTKTQKHIKWQKHMYKYY